MYKGLTEFVDKFNINDRISFKEDGTPEPIFVVTDKLEYFTMRELFELEDIQVQTLKQMFNDSMVIENDKIITVDFNLIDEFIELGRVVANIEPDRLEMPVIFLGSYIGAYMDIGKINRELLKIVFNSHILKSGVTDSRYLIR